MVAQEASYYDMPENARGTLTSHLASDAAAVRGILGERLALVVQSVALIAGACAVAFYYCPKVGAVVLGAAPMLALGGECRLAGLRGKRVVVEGRWSWKIQGSGCKSERRGERWSRRARRVSD